MLFKPSQNEMKISFSYFDTVVVRWINWCSIFYCSVLHLWMVCAHRTNESRLTQFNNADIEMNMNHDRFHYRVQHYSSFAVKILCLLIKRIDAGPFWLPMHVLVSINCGLICVRLCWYVFHLIFVMVVDRFAPCSSLFLC